MRLRVATGIGGHDWNILIVGEIKEMWFRFFFKRIQTADDLDIKPAREQSLKPVCIGSRSFRLILCEQSGQRALAACRQCYQTVSATFKNVQHNMRLFLNRTTKLSNGPQSAKSIVALTILGIKKHPNINT